MIKKILSILCSLFLLTILFTGCNLKSFRNPSNASPRSLQQIKQSGEIIIGVFSDKKPFGYIDQNGDYQGYDVQYAQRIAQDLGVQLTLISVEPANRVEYLTSGKADIILANFTVTPERSEKVDFALPYMKVSLGVVSPKDALIMTPEQLNGKQLIVAKGTTAETYFSANYPDVQLIKYDQYTEAFGALLDRRGHALSTDNTEVLAWAMQHQDFSVGIESLGHADTIAAAVQKGNIELLAWLNRHIIQLGDERFFHDNYQQTLEPVYGDTVSPDSIIIEGGRLH